MWGLPLSFSVNIVNQIEYHRKMSIKMVCDELIWKLLLVWLDSVNLKNNEWLNMVDLCEFAVMIKYPIPLWGIYVAG